MGLPYSAGLSLRREFFLGLRQGRHQNSLKTPNQEPSWLFSPPACGFLPAVGVPPLPGPRCTAPTRRVPPTNPAPNPKAREGAGGEKGSVPRARRGGRHQCTGRCRRLGRGCCGIPVGRLPVGRDAQQEGQVWEGVAVGRVASPRCILMLRAL